MTGFSSGVASEVGGKEVEGAKAMGGGASKLAATLGVWAGVRSGWGVAAGGGVTARGGASVAVAGCADGVLCKPISAMVCKKDTRSLSDMDSYC